MDFNSADPCFVSRSAIESSLVKVSKISDPSAELSAIDEVSLGPLFDL